MGFGYEILKTFDVTEIQAASQVFVVLGKLLKLASLLETSL